MFNFIKIIFFSLIILCTYSCTPSPVKEIKKSFYSLRINKSKFFKIKKIEIYDTLYYMDVKKEVDSLEKRFPVIKRNYDRMKKYRDSINNFNYPRPKYDSLIKAGIQKSNLIDREMRIIAYKQIKRYELLQQIDENICGYYVKIITPKDTFKVVVSALNFRIISPVFIYE